MNNNQIYTQKIAVFFESTKLMFFRTISFFNKFCFLPSNKQHMQLFETAGNIVATQTLQSNEANITMPNTPGQYILQMTANGVSETFKIVVE